MPRPRPPAPTEQSAAAILAERRSRAIALRVAGASNTEIAMRLGYTTDSHVSNDVDAALVKHNRELSQNVAAYRVIELMRLDKLHASRWAKALAGDDAALDRIMKIAERRAKILGLDAATTKNVIYGEVNAWRNSDEWQATVGTILEAVQPYPEAAEAIFDALERLRMATDEGGRGQIQTAHAEVIDADILVEEIREH